MSPWRNRPGRRPEDAVIDAASGGIRSVVRRISTFAESMLGEHRDGVTRPPSRCIMECMRADEMREKSGMIRAIICDDHPIVREGVRLVVNASKDIVLEDEAANGHELLEKIRKHSFDVVILDISLRDGPEGLEILKSIQLEQPRPAVLILTMHPEEQSAVRALRAGAAGYLVKGCEPAELLSAIRKVAGGGKYITPTLAEILASDVDGARVKPPHESLSDREYKVLCLLAGGKSLSDVARDLCLSPSTVGTYRSRILEKLGLKTNADLVRYSLTQGLLD